MGKRFEITDHRKKVLASVFTFFYCFAFGFYIYYGFLPQKAEAEGPIRLEIPSISLKSPVDEVEKISHKLETPDYTAGKYSENTNKTLIFGHSTTVFKDLEAVKVGDTVTLDGQDYRVTKIQILEKSYINMDEILAPADVPTLVIMTCHGEKINRTDAKERLLLTAELTE